MQSECASFLPLACHKKGLVFCEDDLNPLVPISVCSDYLPSACCINYSFLVGALIHMLDVKKNIFKVEFHKSKFFDWVISALIFPFLLLVLRIKSLVQEGIRCRNSMRNSVRKNIVF